MFPNCNGFKLEINRKKITGTFPNTWKLNNSRLDNP